MLPGQGAGARITVRPGRRPARGRTPFAVLVVVLLTGGLLGLLALNTALNEGSFELSRLQKQTTTLTDQQQTLQHQIDQGSAPDALERRARELGMVPAGGLAFLQDDGKVLGKPGPAQDSPPVKRSGAEPWQLQPGAPAPAPASAPAPAPALSPAPPPSAAAPAAPAPSGSPTGDTTVQINPAGPATQPTPSPSGGPAR
ncbi:cell division protein FtsL [Kitasatospora sp. NBC_00240]|uniref:cell division protein FtsL n=1 Tax=Kitasatospora sp. NBC_00240 TaxID=2903567 RepID=UPI002252E880|nr:cell division protein FtsL [Kitasatospora sp. NBC_00240]MCX5213434.1 cell division protein FtsL [Kitasatospora sp. NBC_00240]